VWRMPYYLTVSLKRFRHDRTGEVLSKNTTPVALPARLDPLQWIDAGSSGGSFVSGAAPASRASTAVPSPLYSGIQELAAGPPSSAASPSASYEAATFPGTRLMPGGAEYQLFGVIRHSGWISGGHYTASCLCDGRWVLFNDGMVAADRPERLAADDGVYVAFYRLRHSSSA
jgi:hypothetical protein